MIGLIIYIFQERNKLISLMIWKVAGKEEKAGGEGKRKTNSLKGKLKTAAHSILQLLLPSI